MTERLVQLGGRLAAAIARHQPRRTSDYLTGFDSSNAALLIRPGGETTLFTDFRYVEEAQAVDGVEAVLTKRAMMRDVGGHLTGSVQFEADVLPYLEWQRLAKGGAKLVRDARAGRRPARDQGRGRDREDRAPQRRSPIGRSRR